MSAFPNGLRTAGAAIAIVPPGAGAFTFRVEASDVWDAVQVVARPETVVADVKQRAVTRFFPNDADTHEYVLKFRGWEILDENAPLRDVGITDGSTVLMAVRRRRPVR